MSRLTQVSLQPNVLVPPIVGSCPGQRFQTRQTDQILGGWVTVHAQSGLALLYELLQKETFVGGPLPTWEEGQWFPLWVHWTGHFFGRAKARGGGRCSRIPSSAIRYWICPCEGHCCAGSPLLAACRGGRPSTGSMVGGISPSPGLAGGKSVAGMAAPTAAVSGNRAECESTASSFS